MPRRPTDFNKFLGQRQIVRYLKRSIAGAKALGIALFHILLLGRSGLGKTMLAEALAKAFGTKCHIIVADAGVDAARIAREAAQWGAYDFVFIDEAHALPPPIQLLFLRILVERRVPKLDGDETVDGETEIPPVTVIAATDRPEKLRKAFIGRFTRSFILFPYAIREMTRIVRQRASRDKMILSPQAAKLLARVSRGIPRNAGHNLVGLKTFFGANPPKEFHSKHVRLFLTRSGIDEYDRNESERRYMAFLAQHQNQKLSLHAIAVALGLSPEFVALEMEPWLLEKGWISITASGRCLTDAGRRIPNGACAEAKAEYEVHAESIAVPADNIALPLNPRENIGGINAAN